MDKFTKNFNKLVPKQVKNAVVTGIAKVEQVQKEGQENIEFWYKCVVHLTIVDFEQLASEQTAVNSMNLGTL